MRAVISELERAVDAVFGRVPELGCSLALVVIVDGEVVAERYGTQPANAFQAAAPVTADTTLISWSTAKSITHAAVGVLVLDGVLDPEAPAPVPEWEGTDKAAIRLIDLLEMRPGLHWVEDYEDPDASTCLPMLFGEASADMAAYAAALPLVDEPGRTWLYSSGTTNIVSRIVGDAVHGGPGGDPDSRRQAMADFLQHRLFGPVGMTSAVPKFDAAGTFVGSSYVYATARDFARFGELYRNDGVLADGTRVLPAGWTEHARTQIAVDPESGFGYGRHWWTWPDYPGALAAHGYEGQYIVVVPDRGLTFVHLGKTAAAQRGDLVTLLRGVIDAVPTGAASAS